MRSTVLDGRVRHVSHDEPLPPPYHHVELELEVGSLPITGFVRDDDGRRDFQGWVDLAAAIAASHQSARPTHQTSTEQG